MGIRFLCSSCEHRLNVKTKQAGQFCICPECEDEIQIPLESTVSPKTKQRKKKRRGKPRSNVEVEITPVVNDQFDDQFSIELERPETPSTEVREVFEVAAAVGNSFEQASQSIVDPERVPAAEEDSEALLSSGLPVDADAVMKALSDSSDTDESKDDDSFLLAKPVVKIEENPLKSDPNLVWYLRHKRLGEKGPLKATQVEAMLESGQLRRGYIVWRQDWNDWVPVEKVFPELIAKPADSTYQIPDELNPHSEVSRKRRSQKRFWMCFNAAGFLILVLLVYWVTQFGW